MRFLKFIEENLKGALGPLELIEEKPPRSPTTRDPLFANSAPTRHRCAFHGGTHMNDHNAETKRATSTPA
jgi:hypothetical protein